MSANRVIRFINCRIKLLTLLVCLADFALFNMDASGRVTVAAGAIFDRETRDSYELLVGAVDEGTPPAMSAGKSLARAASYQQLFYSQI